MGKSLEDIEKEFTFAMSRLFGYPGRIPMGQTLYVTTHLKATFRFGFYLSVFPIFVTNEQEYYTFTLYNGLHRMQK